MPSVLSLVNTVSSTSIPVEIANAVNKQTPSQVTVGSMLEGEQATLDPDVEEMNLPLVWFDGKSNFDPRAYKRLVGHLKNEKYDIVHTHHNFTGSLARGLSKLFGVSLVNTEHNDLSHYTRTQRAVNSVTFGCSAVNVYNSYSTRDSRGAVERLLSKHDEVIYNGVDVDRISASEGYPLPVTLPDATVVTNVGVMTDQKNQRLVLEAAHVLDRVGDSDVQFVIAGSGPLESELRKMADELGVDDSVTFTGYLSKREQVYSLLHESDAFVTPSLYEGFCVAAVEAMACGVPVIASDIPVFREVIGDRGRFVDPTDTESLADEIIEIAEEDPSDRGTALQKRAITTFPLRQTAQAYHDLYAKLTD